MFWDAIVMFVVARWRGHAGIEVRSRAFICRFVVVAGFCWQFVWGGQGCRFGVGLFSGFGCL